MNKDKMIEAQDLFIAPDQQDKEEKAPSILERIRLNIKNQKVT